MGPCLRRGDGRAGIAPFPAVRESFKTIDERPLIYRVHAPSRRGIMENAALEQYLHRQIPLSAAMQVTVSAAKPDSVILSAPLEPNVNHKSTAFGGSISTLGILAAWSLVHLRLLEEGLTCEVVIQSNQMDYDKPITGTFAAASSLHDPAAWPAFLKTLTRRGIARIEVGSDLIFEEAVAGRLSGRFVAFLQKP